MRILLDTNVLASAAAARGLCADVLREVLAEHHLIVCSQIVEELRRVLRVQFGVPTEVAGEFAWLIQQDTIMANPVRLPEIHLKDKDDLGILAAALCERADLLVTGDKELLGLKRVGAMRILGPREFWNELTARQGT